MHGFDQPASGAYVSQEQLIALRFAAKQLPLGGQQQRMSPLIGGHRSVFKGRGLEFAEVRQYQGGDEIRHIDWRVTARTNKAHTKLFQEEKEKPLILCLDQRQSLFFGSRHCFKSVLAAEVASTLAWSGLNNNDRVGGLVFNDSGHSELRPRRSRRNVLHWAHQIEHYNSQLTAKAETPAQAFGLSQAVEELRRVCKPGSTVFVISDFYGFDAIAQKGLHQLARHNQVVAIGISDPLEQQLPERGKLNASDGSQRLQLRLSRKLNKDYQAASQSWQQELKASLRRSGVRYVPLRTDQAWLPLLQQGLLR